MKHAAWLIRRAALALLLIVSSYALALGIGVALLWIPYEVYANDVRLLASVTLSCVMLAGTIVWSTPRRKDRSVAPCSEIIRVDAPEPFSGPTEIVREVQPELSWLRAILCRRLRGIRAGFPCSKIPTFFRQLCSARQ